MVHPCAKLQHEERVQKDTQAIGRIWGVDELPWHCKRGEKRQGVEMKLGFGNVWDVETREFLE